MEPGRCDEELGLKRNVKGRAKTRTEERNRMQESVVQGRMNNPVMLVPGALQPLLELANSAREVGLSPRTADLVHLRAAQVNGCSYCVDMHSRDLKEAGETDERLFAVAAWREAPYFSEAERAGLALTEAATRLSDRPDPVPDGVFEEAARHYDEPTLAALIIEIALINFWNRTTVAVRQVAGSGSGCGAPQGPIGRGPGPSAL